MQDKITDFRQLTVWQKAHQLVLKIYQITRQFPSEEKYGLVSQMRRGAVSVPANIAEGFQKKGVKDKLNFYNIAQASLEELKYYMILSQDLGYIKDIQSLWESAQEIARMLSGLIASIDARKKESENKGK